MSADYVYRQAVSQMIADKGLEGTSADESTAHPPHPASLTGPLVEWCKLPGAEQVRVTEERRFERCLGVEVRKRHEAGWPEHRLIAFCEEHRRRFRGTREASGEKLEPCKHWRKRFREAGGEPAVEALLERTWDASVRSWMLEYPYLGSPSAPCGCSLCDPHGARMRRAERQGALVFGELDDDWRDAG